MESEPLLDELLSFLHSTDPNARRVALSNLLGYTLPSSPHHRIFFRGLGTGLSKPAENTAIKDLKLLCRDQLAIAHDAFTALVNLSSAASSMLVAPITEPSFLAFIVSYILSPKAILADLAAMLLWNMSTASAVSSALLALQIPVVSKQNSDGTSEIFFPESRSGTCASAPAYSANESRRVLALPLMLDAFSQVKPHDSQPRLREGNLHSLASVFTCLSMTPAGRAFFLTPRPANPLDEHTPLEYPLAKLVAFTEHPDVIRRGGVASTIKNCSFHASAHRALLTPDSELVTVPPSTVDAPGIGALPHVLLPLAGPEELDLDAQDHLPPELQLLPASKRREPDDTLRRTHVETLLLLCTTRWGRERLRESGIYEVVRVMHENETVDEISELVERLVNLLKRDEGPDTAEDDGGAGDSVAEVERASRGDESEDEDDQIVEV